MNYLTLVFLLLSLASFGPCSAAAYGHNNLDSDTAYAEAMQTTPRFQKYDVGASGCKIYLPAAPDSVTMKLSPDSSKVYTLESVHGKHHFGAIVVDLKDPITAEDREPMLIAYMEYLQDAFGITESAGVGKGHTLKTHPAAAGVLDFWIDGDADQWQVKGWADTEFIVVMFIYGEEKYPNYDVTEVFFSGFRFPGD